MKKILSGALGVAIIATAMPASAAIVLCTGSACVATDQNVLINRATASVITGNTNRTNTGVTFTSFTDASLVGDANGQASVGAADQLLNSLTFTVQSAFAFTSALFDLSPLPGDQPFETTSALFNFTTTTGIQSATQPIGTSGSNFIGVSGSAGELFTSVTFIANQNGGGIGDLRQLRLGGVRALNTTAPVPEPSTWAMLLLGMFGIGGAVRSTGHRKVQKAA